MSNKLPFTVYTYQEEPTNINITVYTDSLSKVDAKILITILEESIKKLEEVEIRENLRQRQVRGLIPRNES